MPKSSSRLLIDDYPLVVLPETAVKIGLNEAMILQQVHYWVKMQTRNKSEFHLREGRYWTYGTYSKWQEQFPFWCEATVVKAFRSLERDYFGSRYITRGPLLLSGHFSKDPWDRTKWYTIDYDELERVGLSVHDRKST